jgi:organic hydroperoxide reductase OsmC/OhrA
VSDVHTYRAELEWRGSTGAGYDAYDRGHTVTSPPAEAELTLTSGFGGDPRLMEPEQLLVAAASSCQLLSFLAVAARARIDVIEYTDTAEGAMDMADKPQRVGRIVLRPRVVVARGADEQRVRHLVELAHEHCFIANSLNSEMTIEAQIEVRS